MREAGRAAQEDGKVEEIVPVSVLFVLHGRGNDRTQVANIAQRMLQIQTARPNPGWKRELVVVTFVRLPRICRIRVAGLIKSPRTGPSEPWLEADRDQGEQWMESKAQ